MEDMLFGGAGDVMPVSSDSFNQAYENIVESANRRGARKRNREYLEKLRRATDILVKFKEGRISTSDFQEVLTTSDFPILFGDILDRRLLDQYQVTTPSWQAYASRGTVPDFRQSRIIAIDGLQNPFYPSAFDKPEGQDLKYDNTIAETGYTTQVKVYERGYALSWRMFINRALNFIDRFPTLLANGARRTESKFAVDLFVNSGGPDSTFFSSGNANIVNTTNGAASNNPALSVQGLKDALNVLLNRTDSGGDPIEINGAVLVVPPLLALTADEIIRGTQLELVPATSAAGTRVFTPNWVREKIKVVTEWYLPIIDQTANKHTTWYLFADPNVGRPAMEVTFLQGYEQPSFWQKAPNTMRMGGGVDPMMGDFSDMSQHYKAMHIVGGTLLDPKMAVVSNGSGS